MATPFRTAPHRSAPIRSEAEGPSAPILRCTPSSLRGGVQRKVRKANRGKSKRENMTPSAPIKQVLPEEGFWPAVPITDVADEWIILRCASSATTDLAEKLREEGLLAWAPMVRVQKRLPRRKKTELVVRPLLPSFVFVAFQHGEEAIDLASRGRVHQCKRFLFNECEVTIPGIQLGPLYLAQIRGSLREAPLVPGDRVEILASLLYLQKGKIVSGRRRDDSYEVELNGQNQRFIFPGFLLRKTLT